MQSIIKEDYPNHAENLDNVSRIVCAVTGRDLYPNAAAYTAITSEIMNLIPGTEIMLAIVCRLPAWAKQYEMQERC
jgi:hypothetical protein